MTTLTVRRAAWIVVGVLAVFGLRLIVGGTGDVRIGFLFVVPVGMAVSEGTPVRVAVAVGGVPVRVGVGVPCAGV